MAKRNYRKSSKKIQPAVQNLFFATPEFSVPGGGLRTDFYIDISQCASLVNRRFYRQGLNWAVAGFKFNTSTDIDSIEILKLPNTWVMSNSWEKAFRAWQKMNNNALEETPSIKPKFLDFKIYADDDHKDFKNNLMPYAGTPSASSRYIEGEWEPSKVVVPSQTANTVQSYEILATGATTASRLSLIEGYAASRSLPNIVDPNAPADAGDPAQNWLQSMFSDGTAQDDTVIDDMLSENNVPPYPFEGENALATDTYYPGGANQGPGLELHDATYINNTSETIILTQHMRGGNFPCGLVKISMTSSGAVGSTAGANLQLMLVPGEHRGYLAEPMTEM